MRHFFDRVLGAAKLDADTYEAVEHDSAATAQAALVVIISSIAASIGVAFVLGPLYLIYTTVFALIQWILWAALLWLIGTQMLPEEQTEADVEQLFRTLGFATAPGVLRIFSFIPYIGWIIALVAYVWMVAAMVVAVRQALDFRSTLRAVGVVIIGWVIAALIVWLIGGLTGLGVTA